MRGFFARMRQRVVEKDGALVLAQSRWVVTLNALLIVEIPAIWWVAYHMRGIDTLTTLIFSAASLVPFFLLMPGSLSWRCVIPAVIDPRTKQVQDGPRPIAFDDVKAVRVVHERYVGMEGGGSYTVRLALTNGKERVILWVDAPEEADEVARLAARYLDKPVA